MKVRLFTFFTILLSALSYGQQLRVAGRVVSSPNNTPLPYANIIFENYRTGTSTNAEGMFVFSIPDSLRNENLIISYVGYFKKTIKIEDLITQKMVPLIPKTEGLDEVSLVPVRNKKSFTYRPEWMYETVGIGNMNAELFPSTIARYYPKPEKFDGPAFLESIKIYFYATSEQVGLSPKFRLHIYNITKNGLPGEDILNNLVLEKNASKSSLDVELLDKKIVIPENGFYIGLEHLFIKENEYTEVKDYYINNEMVAMDYENTRFGPVYKGVFAETGANFKVYFYQPGGWVDIRTWDITWNDRAEKYVTPVFKVKITD